MTAHPSRYKLAGREDGRAGAPYLQRPLAVVNKANLRRPHHKLA
jgi:hypothetical protein